MKRTVTVTLGLALLELVLAFCYFKLGARKGVHEADVWVRVLNWILLGALGEGGEPAAFSECLCFCMVLV